MLIRSLAPIISALMMAGLVTTINNSASTTPGLPEGIQPLGAATSTSPVLEAPKTPVSPRLSERTRLTAAGGDLLKAVVNIYCVADPSAPFRGTSGSGVIMDERGLILTASHVAQLFLLEDYPKKDTVRCTIRTGGPAQDAYTAEVVYVSPSWVKANARTLSQMSPRGNGQHDFAVLAITGSANGYPLPASFPHLTLSEDGFRVGDRVAIGGYAAQFLGAEQIRSTLYPIVVFDDVEDQYTFGKQSVDVLSVSGTSAAQGGASGGGVASADSELLALIANASVTDMELNAITAAHIRTSFKADMGTDFDRYFSSRSIDELITAFAPTASELRKRIISTF